jgi:hypothetical protein
MEHLRWQRVNQCETIKELQQCILDFSDEFGMIQGRSRPFIAEKMAEHAGIYFMDSSGNIPPNVITREYGLRQQVVYLKFYKDNKSNREDEG